MPNRLPVSAVVFSFLMLTTCEHREYEIEVIPDGAGFERKLTVRRWEHKSGPAPEQATQKLGYLAADGIERLTALYEEQMTGIDSKE